MDNNNSKTTLRELIGEEYLDYEFEIDKTDYSSEGETIKIRFLKDGRIIRYINYALFNGVTARPMSNFVDGLYSHTDINKGDHIFLWSYELNGKVRAFAGLTNCYYGITYPFGYDLNSKQFIRFPINELGLMDETKMKEMLNVTGPLTPELGFDPKVYNETILYRSFISIVSMLYNKREFKDGMFKGSTEIAEWIIKYLDEYNESEISKVTERLKEDNKTI